MRVLLLSLAVVLAAACTGGPSGNPSDITTGIGIAPIGPGTTPEPAAPAEDVDETVDETEDETENDSGERDGDDARGDGPDAIVPEGYALVQATVTEPDGTVCELCLWSADTAERRRQGLMFVTDLGAGDGMAFVYPVPHSGTFWMKNTVLPLSIAFFGVGGTYLGEFDMEPCTADPCGLYRTPDDFLVAVEVEQGGLSALGIGPGSVLELTDLPCDAPTD